MSIGYNPKIVTDGLVLCLDAANPKSFSPNVHPKPTDIYGWVTTGNNCNLSRDTISSPVGNTPLKMDQTGNDPYTNSYSGSTWKLAPAAVGQTWTVSVWVKASQTIQIEGCWIAEQDASGNYLAGGGSPYPTIGTDWVRIKGTYTTVNASIAYVGTRLDGTQTGGSGVTIWWDGLQVELASSTTTFNPKTNTNRANWLDLLTNSAGTLTGSPLYSSLNGGSLVFNGSTQETQLLNTNYPTNATDPFSVETTIYIPSDATWTNTYYGNILSRGSYQGAHGLWRTTTNNQISMHVRQNDPYAASEAMATITRDTWYHVIGTWDGYYPKIYVNGSLVSTGYLMTPTTTYESDIWWIGAVKALGGSEGNRFKGNVGVAKVYNRALTASEVQSNFNAVRGRYGL